eukprot:14069537-Alexandrium_andersonii.AAC.1
MLPAGRVFLEEWQSKIDWKFLQRRSKSGSESFRTGIVCSNLMPASVFSRSSAAAPEPHADGSAGAAETP